MYFSGLSGIVFGGGASVVQASEQDPACGRGFCGQDFVSSLMCSVCVWGGLESADIVSCYKGSCYVLCEI